MLFHLRQVFRLFFNDNIKTDKPTNFTKNRLADIWLTKDRSRHTNHILQFTQPITSRLNWQTTNNITRSSTNQDNDQRLIYWRFTVHLTLMMTSAQVVKTSVFIITNSPSQDYTHLDNRNLPTYVYPIVWDGRINLRWETSFTGLILEESSILTWVSNLKQFSISNMNLASG